MAWSRESRHARGYGAAWVRLRRRVLMRDTYLCQPCRAKGRVTPATEVHHVKAKAAGGTDEEGNLLSVCGPCHSEATAAQLGRRPRLGFTAEGWPVLPEG